jgi:hypothetical protein
MDRPALEGLKKLNPPVPDSWLFVFAGDSSLRVYFRTIINIRLATPKI